MTEWLYCFDDVVQHESLDPYIILSSSYFGFLLPMTLLLSVLQCDASTKLGL